MPNRMKFINVQHTAAWVQHQMSKRYDDLSTDTNSPLKTKHKHRKNAHFERYHQKTHPIHALDGHDIEGNEVSSEFFHKLKEINTRTRLAKKGSH